MIEKIKYSDNLIDLIYALEPLCYYFSMKPTEFWNSTYRELNLFIQSNLCHIMDEFRQDIRLYEAATDKIIMADAMSNRRPKIIPLQKTFEKLFPKRQEKNQSPEEITRKMREIMNL